MYIFLPLSVAKIAVLFSYTTLYKRQFKVYKKNAIITSRELKLKSVMLVNEMKVMEKNELTTKMDCV